MESGAQKSYITKNQWALCNEELGVNIGTQERISSEIQCISLTSCG